MDISQLANMSGAGWIVANPFTFILLLAWSIFWKGFALWFAARRSEKWWFVIFLVVNTAGILEIIYLFFVAKIPAFRSKVGLKTNTAESTEPSV